jgi:DNA-binding transcriptional LysR family regulator
VELRQLRSFIVLADELHFSRAAERLHIVQPALSKQIKALETDLGFSLVSRQQRGVELTAAGAVFRDQVEVMLRRLDRSVDSARATAAGRAGSLDLGFVRAAMWSILPGALRDFRLAAQNIELRLHELASAPQLQQLRDGILDAGLVRLPMRDDELNFEVIFTERLVVVLPSDHRLAGETRIDLAKLAEETFITLPRRIEPGFYDRSVAQCYEFGFGPKLLEETRGFAAMIGMVGIGMGVTLIPATSAAPQWPNVVVRPLTRTSIGLELALVRRRDVASPALDRLTAALRRASRRPMTHAPERTPPGNRIQA